MPGRVSVVNAGPPGPPGASGVGGTAIIPSGDTSVTVTHGLSYTPTAQEITITPTNSLGSATKYWISGITSVEFVINVNSDPGGTTATFGWAVRKL